MINEEMLSSLKETVRTKMSEKRFLHTLGVEAEMQKMAEIYMPGKVALARAAGLLHDVTKAWSEEQQLAYCAENGIRLSPEEKAAPQILHAKTAAHYVERHMPQFAEKSLLSAILKHTTGSAEMTTLDKMLYIADFIEEGRRYDSCRMLRAEFWGGIAAAPDKARFLNEMLLKAYTLSLEALARINATISPETLLAKAAIEKVLEAR